MKLASIDDAMQALYKYVPNTVSMKANYNLDRMRDFLTQIDNPQDACRVVHIAGTSGKTSSAYFIRALLQEARQVTGLTVSPHIVSVTERVQIDGQPLPEGDFLNHLERFLQIVEDSDIRLTYFEVLIAFAYWIFAEYHVDYAVIETGLGGLLDGTNMVTRADKVCAITDLGLDHTEVLGETIEDIAFQKAGIIQTRNHVFLVDQDRKAMSVVVDRTKSCHATLHIVAPEKCVTAVEIPVFQRRNLALAISVYDHLATRDGLPALAEGAVQNAAGLRLPGRMEWYDLQGKKLILDGAHNPQKLTALRIALEESGVLSAAVLASFVMAPDYKLDAALTELQPLAAHLIVPEFSVVQDLAKQSPSADEMAERARRVGFTSVEVCEKPYDAFTILLQRPEPVLLVTGSLYLVSQVRAFAEKLAR